MVWVVARVHLFEFHDLEWFPAVWRDLLTDFLSFFFKSFRPYACVAPVLAEIFDRVSEDRIVDLCSGAGQPILSILPALADEGWVPSSVTLTDKYPNLDSFRAAVSDGGGLVSCESISIDATDVPDRLTGFRTVFTAFHHFRADEARQILADAQRSGEGIGVFEFTERNWLLWTIPILCIPLMTWVCTPFIRPFRWRRLLWTYLVPVVPVIATWDGFVSNLRSYSIGELEELISDLDRSGYHWRVGRVRSIGLSRVTCLVGCGSEEHSNQPGDSGV